ncbi:LptA/OstA family protein [Roseovarius salinarum]|uniref:LptA/OstA family protein n=1 Tax=Roseovarius salinarum TaxID=1981892 RepID=UPI000C333C88|nr:LptA/OstA family protein [Roseovarius salinarum]
MAAQPAAAQGAEVAFGGAGQARDLPVEISADNLTVNQNDGAAEFTGDVFIGQGDMRLSAPRVRVIYRENSDRIARLEATGGVTLVSGDDAAEAARADYDVENGTIDMRGDVLLVQRNTTLTAERMTVDTVAGTARISGRVKTVIGAGD